MLFRSLQLARKLADGARLVSVLGMGGTGKTRLVTRFAWTWLGDYPGGVWFCDLSQARTLDGIHFAVAQGLDVPLGKTDPVVQLAHAIAGRGRCLVILDNFEQVARHAEETLGRWLDRAAQAKFIVTTREVLGIVGEETMALAPLPACDAMALFLRRAEAAKEGYQPSSDDEGAIEKLVELLDCLPLAIELAAARMRVMRPQAMLSHIGDRFILLSANSSRPARQSTLRGVFDWSWDLLTTAERIGLAQLSVFVGGFTIEAAEATLDLSRAENAPWFFDVLQSLVDKSFIRQRADRRFDLFQSTREYAAEKLEIEGQFPGSGSAGLIAAERRHGAYFAAQGSRRAIGDSCVELENLVVACRRAASRGDVDIAVKALVGSWRALKLRGPYKVAVELAEAISITTCLSASSKEVLAVTHGRILMTVGRTVEARSQFEAAICLTQTIDDPSALPRALSHLAELEIHEGKIEEARIKYAEALRSAQALEDQSFLCDVLSGLGNCHHYLGQFEQARMHHERALIAARESGDRRWEGGALGNLGEVFVSIGMPTDAREFYLRALAIALELGDRQWEGNVRCNLGLLDHTQGRMDSASGHLTAALQVAQELGHVRLESVVLCNLGIVKEARGFIDDAYMHYEAALKLAQSLGDRRSEGQFLGYLGALHARQHRPSDATACLGDAERLTRAVSDRSSLGIVLCFQAEAAILAGQRSLAASKVAEASALADEYGSIPESEFGSTLKKVREFLNP